MRIKALLVASLCAIVPFFAQGVSTWAIPQGVNLDWGNVYHYAAVGTEATCRAQAAGIQFGMVTVYLGVSLSLQYALVVKYNVSETKRACSCHTIEVW